MRPQTSVASRQGRSHDCPENLVLERDPVPVLRDSTWRGAPDGAPLFFSVRPAWALARRSGVNAALIPSSTPRRVLDSVLAHAGGSDRRSAGPGGQGSHLRQRRPVAEDRRGHGGHERSNRRAGAASSPADAPEVGRGPGRLAACGEDRVPQPGGAWPRGHRHTSGCNAPRARAMTDGEFAAQGRRGGPPPRRVIRPTAT